MKGQKAHITLSEAVSLIEATATPHSKPVAVQYVNKDGAIVVRIVRKSRSTSQAPKPVDQPRQRGTYHMRDRGLLPIIDQEQQQRKNLLVFAIVGFSPTGDTKPESFYPVYHGR